MNNEENLLLVLKFLKIDLREISAADAILIKRACDEIINKYKP